MKQEWLTLYVDNLIKLIKHSGGPCPKMIKTGGVNPKTMVYSHSISSTKYIRHVYKILK